MDCFTQMVNYSPPLKWRVPKRTSAIRWCFLQCTTELQNAVWQKYRMVCEWCSCTTTTKVGWVFFLKISSSKSNTRTKNGFLTCSCLHTSNRTQLNKKKLSKSTKYRKNFKIMKNLKRHYFNTFYEMSWSRRFFTVKLVLLPIILKLRRKTS